jgi:hypothetical protein
VITIIPLFGRSEAKTCGCKTQKYMTHALPEDTLHERWMVLQPHPDTAAAHQQ